MKKGIAPILLFVGVLALVIAAKNGGLFAITGFSALSLTKADYVSNDPELGGEAWNLLIALTGAGESAQGSFGPNTQYPIVDSADNKQAAEDFTLSTKVTANRIEYRIQNDFTQFYATIFNKKNVGLFDIGSAENTCKSNANFLAFVSRQASNLLTGDTICVLKSPAGIKGIVRDDFKRIFEAEITTTKSGVPTTVKINTIDATSVSLGTFGKVRWEGFLTTDVNEPTPTAQDVCALYSFGWRLIDCSDFQTWKSAALPTSIVSCLSQTGSLFTVADNCNQQMNNHVSLVVQGKQFTALGGSGISYSGVASGTETSGIVLIDLPRLYTIPLLTVKLKTSYINALQIVVPAGKPDIISVTSSKFQSGATTKGFITAIVKNVGSGSGAFDISAVCNVPFNSNDRIRLNIDPGQTDSALLTITASVTQPTTDACTVRAIDVNNPNNFDSMQVVVEATNIQICNPGTKTVKARSVLQCNQFGSGYDIVKTCPEDQLPDAITFECLAVLKPPPPIVDIFGGIGNWIIIVLLIIAAIVILPKVLSR